MCQPGKYDSNRVDCFACEAGKYSSFEGAIECNECGIGAVSSTGASTCGKCQPGTYAPNPGGASCLICAAGKYSADEGATSCTDCESGSFSAAGSSVCLSCSA